MRYLRLSTALLGAALILSGQQSADLEAVVTTDLGTFRFEFAPDKAPTHVEHFLKLARQGYYDGSAFFRVVANGHRPGRRPSAQEPENRARLVEDKQIFSSEKFGST